MLKKKRSWLKILIGGIFTGIGIDLIEVVTREVSILDFGTDIFGVLMILLGEYITVNNEIPNRKL